MPAWDVQYSQMTKKYKKGENLLTEMKKISKAIGKTYQTLMPATYVTAMEETNKMRYNGIPFLSSNSPLTTVTLNPPNTGMGGGHHTDRNFHSFTPLYVMKKDEIKPEALTYFKELVDPVTGLSIAFKVGERDLLLADTDYVHAVVPPVNRYSFVHYSASGVHTPALLAGGYESETEENEFEEKLPALKAKAQHNKITLMRKEENKEEKKEEKAEVKSAKRGEKRIRKKQQEEIVKGDVQESELKKQKLVHKPADPMVVDEMKMRPEVLALPQKQDFKAEVAPSVVEELMKGEDRALSEEQDSNAEAKPNVVEVLMKGEDRALSQEQDSQAEATPSVVEELMKGEEPKLLQEHALKIAKPSMMADESEEVLEEGVLPQVPLGFFNRMGLFGNHELASSTANPAKEIEAGKAKSFAFSFRG